MNSELLALESVQLRRGKRLLGPRLELQLRRQEVVLVVGANGAGKTTLCDVIAGDVKPASGRVHWHTDRPQLVRMRQEAMLFETLLVRDHLRLAMVSGRRSIVPMLGALFSGKPQRECSLRAVARTLALETLLSRRVNKLSGGERQRLKLAMTMLARADLVLIDEPNISLDSAGRGEVEKALESIRLGGAAIIVTAHSRTEFAFLDARIIEIEVR